MVLRSQFGSLWRPVTLTVYQLFFTLILSILDRTIHELAITEHVLEDRYDNPIRSGGLCHNIAITGEPKQNSHDRKPSDRTTKRFAMTAKTDKQPLHDTNDKMRMTGETRCRNTKSGQSE